MTTATNLDSLYADRGFSGGETEVTALVAALNLKPVVVELWQQATGTRSCLIAISQAFQLGLIAEQPTRGYTRSVHHAATALGYESFDDYLAAVNDQGSLPPAVFAVWKKCDSTKESLTALKNVWEAGVLSCDIKPVTTPQKNQKAA